MDKLSVIIPVYNVEPKYIQEAINSVLKQTYKNIELIIVNDGSTNKDTLDFLKTMDTSTIKLINQKNKGLGGARNTGIDNATGNYISFLDADDWLDNNYYETLINICEENSCDIACATLCRIGKDYQFDMDKFDNVIVSDFAQKMKYVNNGSTCSKLFKKDLFNKVRYIEHTYYEDNPVLVETFLSSNKVAFTNNVRYYYRENPKSICLEPSLLQKRQIDGLYMLNEIYNKVKNKRNSYKKIAIDTFSFLRNEGTYDNHKNYQNNAEKILHKDLIEYLNNGIFYSPLEKLFSIKNSKNQKHKIINLCGIKIKFKRKNYVTK